MEEQEAVVSNGALLVCNDEQLVPVKLFHRLYDFVVQAKGALLYPVLCSHDLVLLVHGVSSDEGVVVVPLHTIAEIEAAPEATSRGLIMGATKLLAKSPITRVQYVDFIRREQEGVRIFGFVRLEGDQISHVRQIVSHLVI